MVEGLVREVKTDIAALDTLDREFWRVFGEFPINSGSIFKFPDDSFPNWGIGVTEENIEWIKKQAKEYYHRDAKDSVDSGYVTLTPFREGRVRQMRSTIAKLTRTILLGWAGKKKNEELHILDIGARDGSTFAAIIKRLYESSGSRDIIPRITWHLLDFSGTLLDKAEAKLSGPLFGIERDRVEKHSKDDELHLTRTPLKFDIIVSVSHFHHKPFSDWYSLLYEKLNDHGFLLIGDFHSPLWQHPYGTYELLRRMGADKNKLNSFLKLFDISDGEKFFSRFNTEELRAKEEHIEHWLEVYDSHVRVMRKGKRIFPEIYMTEAHRTSRQMEKKLGEAGFDVDWKKIRAAFKKKHKLDLPVLPKKLIKGSDYANVTGVAKRIVGGKKR